ncbi:MAG: hypothetical protein ACK559_04970 [bacterium]
MKAEVHVLREGLGETEHHRVPVDHSHARPVVSVVHGSPVQ